MNEISFPYYDKNDFKLIRKLGNGYIGDVFLGEIFSQKKECIVKKLSSANYHENSKDMVYTDMISEIKIGSRFMNKSNHQIQFYGYSVCENNNQVELFLLMEKTLAQSDLAKYIYQDKFWKSLTKEEYSMSKSNTKMYHEDNYWDYIMETSHKLEIMKQMAIALSDIHKFNVLHCDLKPHNMLWVKDKVVLIDYNASQELNDEEVMEGPAELGTPGYMPREMYDGWLSYKGDIYSLGVSMLEVWFGDIWPRESYKYKACRKYVLDYLYLLKQDNSEVYKLISKCVSPSMDKRPILKNIIINLDRMIQSQETVQLYVD